MTKLVGVDDYFARFTLVERNHCRRLYREFIKLGISEDNRRNRKVDVIYITEYDSQLGLI